MAAPLPLAIVRLALDPAASLAALADGNEALEDVLQALAFDITPDKRRQLGWLVRYFVLQEFIGDKSRCRDAVARFAFRDGIPTTTMINALEGRSGVGGLARKIIELMDADERERVANETLGRVT